jgi:hypothetical protein
MKIAENNLREHPAVIAWNKIKTGSAEPTGVETLQDLQKKKKPLVYRLQGIGPSGTTIIAKRCPRTKAARERVIYEDILPRLPLPTLMFYGLVQESHHFAWLFLEDASGEPYSPLHEDHRAIFSRWLGIMHKSATHLIGSIEPSYWQPLSFEQLRLTYDTIEQNLSNPALNSDDVALLKTIRSQYGVIASHWKQLERFCNHMPRTLVHGDLRHQHMRVRTGVTDSFLCVFDWEEAGKGIPFRDILRATDPSINLDIGIYYSVVCDRWPFLDIPTIQRLGHVGEMFRCLEHLAGYAAHLQYQWIRKLMIRIRIHATKLDALIKLAPWED